MVLTRESVEQNTYYEHGSLYYSCLLKYHSKPPDIIPEKMKEMDYTFTGMALCVYDHFDKVYQIWFEVKRSRSKRYVLWNRDHA